MNSLTLELTAFMKKARGNADALVRKVVLDMGTRIVLRSPVDTGRFRANWQYGESVAPQGTVPSTDKSGGAANAKIAEALRKDAAGHVHFIVNNLPYAVPLENGWSKQAPNGMVALTITDFQGVVRRIAKAMT